MNESEKKCETSYEIAAGALEAKTTKEQEPSTFLQPFEAKKYALFMQISLELAAAPELVELILTWQSMPPAIRDGFLATVKAFQRKHPS